jgi:hypothetical protein
MRFLYVVPLLLWLVVAPFVSGCGRETVDPDEKSSVGDSGGEFQVNPPRKSSDT